MRPVHLLSLALLWICILGPHGKVQAQECERPQKDTLTLSDDDVLKTEFPEGSRVRFECAVGYRSTAGSGVSTCTAGTWTDVTLTCQPFNCPGHDIINGEVVYPDGPSFGKVAEFTCNEGYTLVGDRQLTCGNEGWLGRNPTCEVVKCASPPQVENAGTPFPNKELNDYASVVRYTCLKDYTMNGSASLTCSINGQFTPNPPTCIKVRCQTPNIPNASFKSGARPPYVFRSSVVYQCDSGFTMSGKGDMKCELNSTWSSTLVCTDEKVVPTKPTDGKPVPTKPTDGKPVPPNPTDGSSTWSQSWWFIVLIIIIVVIILISLVWVIRKRRGSKPDHVPVEVDEDKIL